MSIFQYLHDNKTEKNFINTLKLNELRFVFLFLKVEVQA